MDKETFSVLRAKIVGTAKEGVWAQVLTLENLQAVMVLSDGEDGKLGREILSFLEEADQKLEKKNLAELSSLLEELKKQIPSGKYLSLVVALVVGKVLYLACLSGAAFLKRKEKFGKIIEGVEEASGFLENDDLLILGSEQFFQVVTPETLRQNLNHFSPEEIAERLAPQVSSAEENAACAALILHFQKEEEVWSEELEETEEEEAAEEEKGEPKEEISPPAVGPSLLAKFSQKIESFKIGWPRLSRPLHLPLEESNGKKRKTLLTVAILLIALLVMSIFFGISKTREGEKSKKFTELYQAASFKYEEGKGLVGLNDALARNRLFEAKGQIKTLRKISLNRVQEKQVQELEEGIKESLVILSRVYKLDSLSLFWETSLIKEGSQGEALAIFEDQMAILDQRNRLVYFLSAETKAVEALGGKDLPEEPKLLGLHGENIYLLTEKGIVRINARSKKAQLVVEKDEGWGDLASLVSYGGNLYLLDRQVAGEGGGGQIWKYIGGETAFSSRREYLASDIKPDFSQAKEMAIDGSVWVLLPERIIRFASGRPESFVISGLEGSFGQPRAIFTNEKSQNLYLLDPQNKKILVLDKDGSYQAQYEAEEIAQAQDLVVSEEEKKIFLLSGSKIYFIEIKL